MDAKSVANYYRNYYRQHLNGECPDNCIFCRDEVISDLFAMDPTLTDLEYHRRPDGKYDMSLRILIKPKPPITEH